MDEIEDEDYTFEKVRGQYRDIYFDFEKQKNYDHYYPDQNLLTYIKQQRKY